MSRSDSCQWATVPVLVGRQCRCSAPCGSGRRRRTGRRNDASLVLLGATCSSPGNATGERLMAFLDDVFVATPTPDRVGPILHQVGRGSAPSRPHPHQRVKKSNVERSWHSPTCMRRIGKNRPRGRSDSKSLAGIAFASRSAGHHSSGHTKTLADHDTLLSRIPLLDDSQSAWALLLLKISRMATTLVTGGVWHGFPQPQREQIPLRRPLRQDLCLWEVWVFGMPSRTSEPAFWASWADCLSMIR